MGLSDTKAEMPSYLKAFFTGCAYLFLALIGLSALTAAAALFKASLRWLGVIDG